MIEVQKAEDCSIENHQIIDSDKQVGFSTH